MLTVASFFLIMQFIRVLIMKAHFVLVFFKSEAILGLFQFDPFKEIVYLEGYL